MGFEPMTSSLPRKCSTPELRRLVFDFGFRMFDFGFFLSFTNILYPAIFKSEIEIPKSDIPLSGRRGSKSRPIAWKAIALPTELLPLFQFAVYSYQFAVFNCPLPTINYQLPLWGEEDSNLRSRKTADLQSDPFGRSGISPFV